MGWNLYLLSGIVIGAIACLEFSQSQETSWVMKTALVRGKVILIFTFLSLGAIFWPAIVIYYTWEALKDG